MTRLTDIQLSLLTFACQRPDGSVLPPPDGGHDRTRIDTVIAQLLKRGFLEELTAVDEALAWRSDSQGSVGAFVTPLARERLGIAAPAAVEDRASAPPSKQAQLVALLRRSEGATLNDIVAATGWLPHSSRAALTGLRKKGHAVLRTGETGSSRYSIAG